MNRRSFLKFIPFTPHLLRAGVDAATSALYGDPRPLAAMQLVDRGFSMPRPASGYFIVRKGGTMLQRFCEATRTGRHAKRLEPGGDILTVNQIFRKGGYQADMLDVRGWE